MAYMLKKLAKMIFPPNTRIGRQVKKLAIKTGYARPFAYDARYQVWMENAEEAQYLHPITHEQNEKTPLFSIVIPAYNTQDKYLIPLINSIVDQSFDDWELILADGSNVADRKQAIKNIAKSDSRIKYFSLDENNGISGNTNKAIEKATGQYLIFADHDDTLNTHALNEIAASVIDNPKIDIIYSDEDKLTDNGISRYWPHLKPSWSPHQFLTCNYTNHVSAIRRTYVNEVGGLRSECNGAQDYDLLLRIHALPGDRVVYHIPKILYHWRAAGEVALTNFLESKNLKAKVTSIKNRPGFYDPLIFPDKKRKVLVVIGKSEDERKSQSLKQTYESITNVSNLGSVDFVTEIEFEKQTSKHTAALRPDDVVIRITENITPKSEDWLLRLVGSLELDDVYAVSPRILGYDGRIWDMGLIDSMHGKSVRLFRGLLSVDDSIYGHTEWIRDVDALSGCFVAIRYKDFINDMSTVKSPNTKQHTTIWSPVEAVFYQKIGGLNGQYNENIEITSDGSKTILWQ